MAFAVRNLSVLAYAQGFTLWHYKAPGQTLAAANDGFFDPASDMLAPGDMLMISASDGGRILFVTRAHGGVQTTALAA